MVKMLETTKAGLCAALLELVQQTTALISPDATPALFR
jgi:hypothetical protein